MLISQAKEIIKCAESFEYFAETYVKVYDPLRGLIPLDQPWQKRLGTALKEHRFVISIKWRDGGIATTHLAYCLWLCLFHEKQDILWIENRLADAENIAKNFMLMLETLPLWMFDKLERNSKHIKQFKHTNNKIWFGLPEYTRSKILSHIVINDAAYIKDMECKWMAMWPCLCNKGSCYVTSSVKEGYNWFVELYQKAILDQNKFYVFESSYAEHCRYQNPEYVKAIKESLGEAAWQTEVEGNFIIHNRSN